MKVYNRQDFLKLPEGTFFCKGVRWAFESLMIKGDTWNDNQGKPFDFLCLDLNDIDCVNSSHRVGLLVSSLVCNTSCEINQDYGRDGSFNDEDVFLVYEKEDLKILRNLIDNSLKNYVTTT